MSTQDFALRNLKTFYSYRSINSDEHLNSISPNDEITTSIHKWPELHTQAQGCFLKERPSTNINSLVKISKKKLKDLSTPEKEQCEITYGNNALHIILKLGNHQSENFKSCVINLINRGINLQQKDSSGKTPREYAEFLFEEPDIIEAVQGNSSLQQYDFPFGKSDLEIVDYINSGGKEFDGPDDTSSSISLLQWCCKQNFKQSIKLLIDKEAIRTVDNNKKDPLLYLAKHPESFNIFFPELASEMQSSILVQWMCSSSLFGSAKFSCINSLFGYLKEHLDKAQELVNYTDDKAQELVNYTDDKKRTALHYAANNGYQTHFQKLLDLKANLIVKDEDGKSPLGLVSHHTLLNEFLDKCITYDSSEITNKGFKITLNYDQFQDKESEYESEFLDIISKNDKLKSLMNHPFIDVFIDKKWESLDLIFYLFIVFNVIALVLVLATVFSNYMGLLQGLQLATVAVLLLGELVLDFYINFEKWYKTTNVYLTFLYFSAVMVYIFYRSNTNLMALSSAVVLLTVFKIFLLLEFHPKFSEHVIILQRTAFRFMTTISYYFLPITAFGISFYVLTEDHLKNMNDMIYEIILSLSSDNNMNELTEKFPQNPIALVAGRTIIVLFGFLINIVLQNVLIAFTIQDLEGIKADAGLQQRKRWSTYIIKFEGFLLKWECSKKMAKIFKKEDKKIVVKPNKKRVFSIRPKVYETLIKHVRNSRTSKTHQSDISKFQHFLDEMKNGLKKNYEELKKELSKVQKKQSEDLEFLNAVLKSQQDKLSKIELDIYTYVTNSNKKLDNIIKKL